MLQHGQARDCQFFASLARLLHVARSCQWVMSHLTARKIQPAAVYASTAIHITKTTKKHGNANRLMQVHHANRFSQRSAPCELDANKVTNNKKGQSTNAG
jgi:hypothetical protein